MKIKVQVKTPKGMATSSSGKLQKAILGFNIMRRIKSECYVNDDDSIIYWDIDANYKTCIKIGKNVARFDSIAKMALDQKRVKKLLDEKGLAELEDMFKNQTKVSIIKNATAEEVEENNNSFWNNIKEKFRKVNPF